MGLSPLLDLAAGALRTQEVVLRTTGHNIANANRRSYSRQEVGLASAPQSLVGESVLGGGVTVEGVRQAVDPLVEAQLLRARIDSAGASAARDELLRLEQVFGDELAGGGLRDALDAFFAAAGDLAIYPQGSAERMAFLARARTLASLFQGRAREVGDLQRQVDERIAADVPRANDLLDSIARLNAEIFRLETGDRSANDLRDARRESLSQLSELIDITQFERDGQVTVIGPNGIPLVEFDRATHLVLDTSTVPVLPGLDGRSLNQIGFLTSGGDFVSLMAGVTGGEIGGLLRIRDTEIPAVATSLDQFVGALRTAVNAVHTNGQDLDGNVGLALFGGTTAADLSVLISDPRQVAASAVAAPPTPENNENALALAALATTVLDGTDPAVGNADLGGTTFVEFLATMVGALGTLGETAADTAEAARSLETELQSQRDAISGVNTNEELLNLLEAQRAFQAAASLVSTATQTIDAILAMGE